MPTAGGGSIIDISSCTELVSTPFSSDYTTSEFAVRDFGKAAATEVATDRIR
ncbi:SDR family NAD(P)-dependent oxidoreductase [Herbiconiux sp. L3-i23]|uniref:SDR family NAD(P)-dependent oxidoreductase n=1 Tax=Herbiconiux sp. L3-i23 TaxID=2905871 RepID=UPI002068D498|nr:SDR family NAD(P)-dependent oxidoreductase [Herbiconiux sp. L3-i23]BDI23052.1 hypothetical protein L3i23_18280 [Herbiconiux sp. L3-i23]